MKRQKNYRQLRSKSPARNRLNEIKSRAVAPDKHPTDAPVYGENNNFFDEFTDKAVTGEPHEDHFDNVPFLDYQFDWDEKFFETASSGSNDFTETIPFELQTVVEVHSSTEEAAVKMEVGSGVHEEITAVHIAEPIKPTPLAKVENEPVQNGTASVTASPAPARYVSVKRQMALAAREAEKVRKPAEKVKTVKKSEAPSLNVRRAPSFRSFVISTIHRLMEEQRFLASEPESSRFLSRELGIGKKEEPEGGNISAQETGQGGTTRWNNPLIMAASKGWALHKGVKGQKSNSSLPLEKQPATRRNSASAKTQPAPVSYKLNAAKISLMEAKINARAISSNMRMKW